MDRDLLKILLVLLSAPFWMPFAKALLDEFIAAMRQDGGFEGPTPSKTRRAEIQAEIDRKEPPRVVIEPLAHILKRGGIQMNAGGTEQSSKAASPPASAAARKSSSRGSFRT